jgi:HPt (histidine-containing phosphotransfer) domain-containing protein
VARVGGDAGLAREMTNIFLADADRLLGDVRAAVGTGRAADLKAAAHAFKGAAGNFNASAVVRATMALEAMAQAGDLAQAAATLRTLEEESAAMVRILRSAVQDGRLCAS